MSSQRSERAWIPASVASAALVIGLFAVWALNRSAGGDDALPGNADASLGTWLLATGNQFFGAAPFSGDGRVLLGTVAAAVVLLVLGLAGTWSALRGLRPGSGLLPAFLSTWMVLVVAAGVAALVRWFVVTPDLGVRGAGQQQFAALTSGALSGVRLGWVAALLGLLVWLVVRPAAGSSRDDAWDDDLDDDEGSSEFVMKRRSDFNLEDQESARRNAETFGRRESDRPHRPPVFDPPVFDPPVFDPPATPDEEAPAATYVGRRSTGRYAEDDDESSAANGSGGSHRG